MTTLQRTARLTGLAYLGLAVSGMLGFLIVRERLHVPGDAAATAAALIDNEALARIGTAIDLTVVLTQALAALAFFALFRRFHVVAATAVGAFGLVNSVVILVAAGFSATALAAALEGTGSGADRTGGAATAQLLLDLTDASWTVGGLFFGLWLIPMGWLAWRSGAMPRVLGWILMAGGVGYVVSTYVDAVVPAESALVSALTLPATVGELWMVGYLLWKGVRPTSRLQAGPADRRHAAAPATASA